jgi:hypothetical protein
MILFDYTGNRIFRLIYALTVHVGFQGGWGLAPSLSRTDGCRYFGT